MALTEKGGVKKNFKKKSYGGPEAEPPEKFLRPPNPPPLKIQKIGERGGDLERIIQIGHFVLCLKVCVRAALSAVHRGHEG